MSTIAATVAVAIVAGVAVTNEVERKDMNTRSLWYSRELSGNCVERWGEQKQQRISY
jgi:hypothetical protein